MAFDHTAAIAARAELAQRLEEIGARYVPAGFAVEYRKSLTGRCYHSPPRISAPKPRTRKALYIFLHECGHANLHHPGNGRRKVQRYVQEFEAEQFAHAVMKAEGVAVPRDMTVRAKRYVRRKIHQAFARGGFRFRDDVAIWAEGGPLKGCTRLKPDHRWKAEIAEIIGRAKPLPAPVDAGSVRAA